MFKAVLETCRPKTLIASVAPMCCVAALEFSFVKANLLLSISLMMAMILIQILTNWYNDYFDLHQGHDTSLRKGPIRPYQRGELSSSQMRWMLVVFSVFYLAFLIPIYQVIPRITLILGILSYFLSIAYSKGNYSLSKLGLSDLFSFLFFGPVATTVSSYALTGQFSIPALMIGLMMGSYATILLVVNHLRDFDEDRKHGKTTTVVRFGKTFGMRLVLVLIAFTMIAPWTFFSWTSVNISFMLMGFFIAQVYQKKFLQAHHTAAYAPLLPLSAQHFVVQTGILVVLCALYR